MQDHIRVRFWLEASLFLMHLRALLRGVEPRLGRLHPLRTLTDTSHQVPKEHLRALALEAMFELRAQQHAEALSH